jgi:hypothetical protein
MPALLPYLPAMMLPLVRLDESSHSSAAPDASLPTHLADVSLQVALMVPDLLMRNGVCLQERFWKVVVVSPVSYQLLI